MKAFIKAFILETLAALAFGLVFAAFVWYGVASSPLYGWL